MVLNVNERILKKIKKSECNETLKNFIRDALMFELEHFEEARPRYMEKYEELIKKYSKKHKESE